MTKDKKARALDIAMKAGVSTSTVDRVLNKRGRVSSKTVRLVMDAQRELEGKGIVGPSPTKAIEVILPENAGNSTRYLAGFFRASGKRRGVSVNVTWVNRMDPLALSDALQQAAERNPDGIAFQALDHALIHDTVNELRTKGLRLTTIVSDLTGHGDLSYVGIDNRAAGRTAAVLMGNYCVGSVAVVWSGQLSRAHEERESGFRTVMRAEFPDKAVIDVNSGKDNPEQNFRLIAELLEKDQSIDGIYCVGAGPSSIVKAVAAAEGDRRITVIAHNLTHVTQAHLLASEIDIVIHQNMQEIADRAIDNLISNSPLGRHTVAVHVITRENTRHHLDLNTIKDLFEDL
jgi:LacI family transcriptional regulator